MATQKKKPMEEKPQTANQKQTAPDNSPAKEIAPGEILPTAPANSVDPEKGKATTADIVPPVATATQIAPEALLGGLQASPGNGPATVAETAPDALLGLPPMPPGNGPATGTPPEALPLPGQAPVKRGRGRPKGSTNKKPGDILPDGRVNFSDIDTLAEITPEQAAVDYQALAELTFDMSTGTLAVAFGDEWKPKTEQERGAVVTSLKRYFEHKQVKDIPPGALLAIVVCAYAAPRFNTPTTKEKLKVFWTWLKLKFQRKKS